MRQVTDTIVTDENLDNEGRPWVYTITPPTGDPVVIDFRVITEDDLNAILDDRAVA